LRRRRRRFGAGFVGETVLNNEWTAERTSCCTMSRITVTRLFCLGIECSFLSRHIRGAMNGKGADAGGLLLNLSLSAATLADAAYRISRSGTRKRAEVARR